MKKQRTLFWGKVPGKTPKKDGSNLPVSRRRFRAVPTGEMEIRFTNTTATQCGGYPLWDSFVGRVGLDAKLARHIKMNRGEGFTAPELSRFFIDTRILGARRLQDVDRMRWDPMLTRTFGLDGLPSDETVGRYFKSFTRGHLASLDRLNTSLNNGLWKKSRMHRRGKAKKGEIILDYDSSTFTVYGKQEGADRGRSFRKKDKGGFQPKFAFIGGLGVMVNQQLYPQSHNLPKAFEDFHQSTLSKCPKTASVWAIRGDGALYSEKRIEWLEKKYVYSISAAMHAPLQKAVHVIPESEWIEDVDADGHRYAIARIRHRPQSWKKARTYIISRRPKDLKGQKVLWEWEKYKYFAYITNFKGIPLEQFKFGVERCSLENFIKEGKSGFHYDFLPHQELDANRAYLGHVQMAYNLSIWWKTLDAPQPIKRWTIQTLRDRLLNICGNLRKYQGHWILSLPKLWPWKSIYQQLAQTGSFTFT